MSPTMEKLIWLNVSFIWFIESAEHAVITAVRSAELV